ncbi:MAG: hypothetical protein ACRCTP_02165 [Aeromonas popoffii]|uniref:hypothetical protein n=1 Tax=Aeromonas popoffii TaxID=70856 RepID=UPI003F2AE927
MKKLIAVVALLVSFSSTAAQFKDWWVNPNATLASNTQRVEGDMLIDVMVYHTGYVAFVVREDQGAPTGEAKANKTKETIVVINGKRVRMKETVYSNNRIVIAPISDEGREFMQDALWNGNIITAQFDNAIFTFSAVGVRDAFRYMQKNRAI